MVWAGKYALGFIESEGRFISLPEGSVGVAYGCMGFDMAFVLVGLSFVSGLMMKQNRKRISLAMIASTVIALS